MSTKNEKTENTGTEGKDPVAEKSSAANNPNIQTTPVDGGANVETQTPSVPAIQVPATEEDAQKIAKGGPTEEQPTGAPETAEVHTGIPVPSNTLGTAVESTQHVAGDAEKAKHVTKDEKYAKLLAAYTKLKQRSMIDVGYEKVLDQEAGL